MEKRFSHNLALAKIRGLIKKGCGLIETKKKGNSACQYQKQVFRVLSISRLYKAEKEGMCGRNWRNL